MKGDPKVNHAAADFDFVGEHRLDTHGCSLAKIDTRCRGPFKGKSDGRQFARQANEQIRALAERLHTQGTDSLLIVLQAPDAAGKDGVIRKVLGRMNPAGCRVAAFKRPTAQELSHDFLWRVHRQTPAAGEVVIFNRSHYEDVLAVRVLDLVPESVWRPRFSQINEFEKLLTAAGTRILKFYLHVSPEEQMERFGDRIRYPAKHWKLNAGDYDSFAARDEYRRAFEEVFKRCHTDAAPWHIIPADRKWYRDAAVAGIVRQELLRLDPQWPAAVANVAEIHALYEAASASI